MKTAFSLSYMRGWAVQVWENGYSLCPPPDREKEVKVWRAVWKERGEEQEEKMQEEAGGQPCLERKFQRRKSW